MSNSVLIVSNTGKLNSKVISSIKDIVEQCLLVNREVNVFQEDLLLKDLLKEYHNVRFIRGLCSKSDDMIYFRENKINFDGLTMSKTDYADIKAKALSRYRSPVKSESFDSIEYDSRRLDVVYKRLKFVITNVADRFTFVVNVKTNDVSTNYYKTPKQEFGNGKFMYIVDCDKNMETFTIGGCEQKIDLFKECLRGDI